MTPAPAPYHPLSSLTFHRAQTGPPKWLSKLRPSGPFTPGSKRRRSSGSPPRTLLSKQPNVTRPAPKPRGTCLSPKQPSKLPKLLPPAGRQGGLTYFHCMERPKEALPSYCKVVELAAVRKASEPRSDQSVTTSCFLFRPPTFSLFIASPSLLPDHSLSLNFRLRTSASESKTTLPSKPLILRRSVRLLSLSDLWGSTIGPSRTVAPARP
jgi:hypothetical protein